MAAVLTRPPQTPRRPQGPRPPGSLRPINCELSPSVRSRITQARADGLGYGTIARQLGVSKSTVQTTVRRQHAHTSGIVKSRPGRPRSLTTQNIEHLVKEIQNHPSMTMRELHQKHASHVSLRTVQRALRKENYKKWKKLKRPRLKPHHAMARLA